MGGIKWFAQDGMEEAISVCREKNSGRLARRRQQGSRSASRGQKREEALEGPPRRHRRLTELSNGQPSSGCHSQAPGPTGRGARGQRGARASGLFLRARSPQDGAQSLPMRHDSSDDLQSPAQGRETTVRTIATQGKARQGKAVAVKRAVAGTVGEGKRQHAGAHPG
jgi:hypothetical protein